MHVYDSAPGSASTTVTSHVNPVHCRSPDGQSVQHRSRPMTENRTVPELRRRRPHKTSMPLLRELIWLVLKRVGTAS
jgi:hypothetical protein